MMSVGSGKMALKIWENSTQECRTGTKLHNYRQACAGWHVLFLPGMLKLGQAYPRVIVHSACAVALMRRTVEHWDRAVPPSAARGSARRRRRRARASPPPHCRS